MDYNIWFQPNRFKWSKQLIIDVMTVIYSHFPEQHGLGVFSRFDSDTIYDVFL